MQSDLPSSADSPSRRNFVSASIGFAASASILSDAAATQDQKREERKEKIQ